MLFVCPKCKNKLTKTPDNRAVCENGHSYDRSKEGYYNLLLNNSGKTHGDNREMVLARRAFLESGAYLPLSDKLCEAVEKNLNPGYHILDGGCGEGYYTDRIARRISSVPGVTVSGFDISRDAVKFAAKKNPSISLAVASSYDMPLADKSVDILLNVFAPQALSETLRVLRAGGKFIMAIPAQNHLFGLKSVLYERPYKNTVDTSELSGLSLISEERISYTLRLDTKEKINSLFMMTPYAYRTPPHARERLLSLDFLETEIDFIVFTYERNL